MVALSVLRAATRMLVIFVLLSATLGSCEVSLIAQGIEAEELSAEALRQDIRFLQMLLTLEMTAHQRLKAAEAIEAFHQKREAITRLAEPPELLTALSAVRDSLLRGFPPTDAQRQAVEAAQPQDREALDQSFREAREEVLTALEGILSDEQKEQLRTLPLAGLANEILEMCLHSRELSPEEAAELRRHAFPEVREQLSFAAGAERQRVLDEFQNRIDGLAALAPEQLEQQRPELVSEIVSFLKTTLDRNGELSGERLRDQLWEWVTAPRRTRLLRDSAEAMGAP